MTSDIPLTGDELARAVGVSASTIRHWHQLGLVSDAVDGHGAEDFERARLVAFAAGRGIPAETVATVNREQGDLLGRFVALAGPPRGVGRTISDASSSVDVDAGVAQRVWDASGLTDQAEVFDEDLALLETAKTALAVGLPDDALLQLLRVYADALGRVADAESRLFNVAARVTAEARRGQFLVTAAVRSEADARDVRFHPTGAPALKGVSAQVELFSVSAP